MIGSHASKRQEILHNALHALHENSGISLQACSANSAQIHLEIDGRQYEYATAIKLIDRFALLASHKLQSDVQAIPTLLVTAKLTPEMAEQCRELGVEFIDVAGNAYLNQPGLYIFIKGQKLSESQRISFSSNDRSPAGTTTSLRIVFAILNKPELLNSSYREISQTAGVALGAVGRVLQDLKTRRYLMENKRDGKRILLERDRLEQEWVINYPLFLRPKLNPRRFLAKNPDWWKSLDTSKYHAQWGSEVGAAMLTEYLHPATFTLYLQQDHDSRNLTKLVVDQKLCSDPEGEIEILNAFWKFNSEQPTPETAPPLLIYADLMASLEPRNLESANLIKQNLSGG